ncbi:MAG: sugar phosphate isomerase/epimerase [Deltaproteobacteria bacterium]|jgi:sugar phosphate isomerase/epimerase|nr:sugar phosphate isomerase/epimerase [Deltaproteobacteria bacterium]
MKLILSAGSLYTLPAHQVFEMARYAGFDGMEVIINHDFSGSGARALLRELQDIHPVLSIHAPFFEIDGWGNKADQLKRCADLAINAEIPLITFHPPNWTCFEFKFWKWLKNITDFQSEIGQNCVTIAIENMPCLPQLKINPYMLSGIENMVRFLEERNLYLTFDTAHCGSMHTDFLGDFHQYYDSGRMRNIHFSDYANGQEHLFPGHGALPLTRFLNHIRETEYDYSLVLELAPHEFPESSELIQETLIELYQYIRNETRHKQMAAKG